MSKFFFSVLLQFFSGYKINSAINAQGQVVKSVTTTFKKEASALILKTSIGLVATGLLLYSLITLGNYFHGFLLKYQSGTLFSVLFFILLSAGSVFLLAKLFYEKKEEQVNSFESLFSKSKDGSSQFDKFYMAFIEGLGEGINHVESSSGRSGGDKIKVKKSEEEKFDDFEPSGMAH